MKLGLPILAISIVLAGCAKQKPEPTGSSVEPSAKPPVPVVATSAPAAAEPPKGAVGRAILTIQDKLDVEKERRSPVALKAEDVYAALEKAGVTLTDKQQFVASIFGAKYCLGAKSGEVSFAVCEYDATAGATAGRDATIKALPAPNRDILVNKTTTFTIRQPPTKTAATEALAKKSSELFATL